MAQHLRGRGGAGNVNQRPHEVVSADDLTTPTIKQSTYTTGRGGAGNMMEASDKELARKAQDVEAPEAHQKEMKGTYHWGRGGEGNKTTIGEDEPVQSKSPKVGPQKGRRSSSRVLEKGKEVLGLGNGDKKSSENTVAVDD